MNIADFQFEIIKEIGAGSFSKVLLAKKKGTNELNAIKKIDINFIKQNQKFKELLCNEIMIMKMVNHPNIIKYGGCVRTKNHYYIAMEYINGGTLKDCLSKYKLRYNKAFSEEIVQYLMRQILNAVKYLHFNKIVHRDLKLENIMIKFDNKEDFNNLNMMKTQVKIIDFGVSKIIDNNLLQTAIGSIDNMDPIIIENFKKIQLNQKDLNKYSEKCDIWSLGTICYELARGKPLFEVDTVDEKLAKIKEGYYKIPTTFSKEITSFLKSMLQYEEKNRESASELLNHNFITKNIKDFTIKNQNNVAKNYEKSKSFNLNTKQQLNDNIYNNQIKNFQQAFGFNRSFYGQSMSPGETNNNHGKSDKFLKNHFDQSNQTINFLNYGHPGNPNFV